MKKFILMITLLISSLLFVSSAFAAVTEVTWTDYKDYQDIDAGNQGRAGFKENLFKNLNEHFAKLAETLPAGQTLKIEVTDVDLAGDTRFGGINDIRIIKDIYPPRMRFSYSLLGSDGTVIQTDEVNVRDMSFMNHKGLRYRDDIFGYEKTMLDNWFKETFSELIVKTK